MSTTFHTFLFFVFLFFLKSEFPILYLWPQAMLGTFCSSKTSENSLLPIRAKAGGIRSQLLWRKVQVMRGKGRKSEPNSRLFKKKKKKKASSGFRNFRNRQQNVNTNQIESTEVLLSEHNRWDKRLAGKAFMLAVTAVTARQKHWWCGQARGAEN